MQYHNFQKKNLNSLLNEKPTLILQGLILRSSKSASIPYHLFTILLLQSVSKV